MYSANERFGNFLEELGYDSKNLEANLKEISTEQGKTGNFPYSIDIHDSELTGAPCNPLTVNYVYTPTPDWIFEIHSGYWNRNDVNVFIAAADDKCYIINAREKPNKENPLDKKINIKTFDYGINSKDFPKEALKEILKESIDSTYFFDFVIKKQKTIHEVDKDLLLNLIALRNELVEKGNERIVHLLILRCLFIKYLEDRGIYDIYGRNYLLNILESASPEKLIVAFNDVQKINGDIFKNDHITTDDIKPRYLKELARFFSSDYRSGQGRLFPYQFDKIPVQLISNVYESFLKSEEKKGKGIFYTPSFIVDFILSHTLKGKLKDNPNATVLDPACGSGAFLIESFKIIIGSQPVKPGYEAKKKILESRLFGIDNDPNALQIAAFSLYLALLETEDPGFIRDQIEHAHPILPDLIGKTLINGNALTDDIFKDKKFDCIVSNPPWGSVPGDSDPENQKERQEMDQNSEYRHVSDYERAQAFLLRVDRWDGIETVFSLIVKNAIFLNDSAKEFRKELLGKYRLRCFYELSGLNKILFKKRIIGEIDGKDIEIGSTEPCAVVVFDKSKIDNNTIDYVSPRLTGFSEKFQLIHFTQKDINEVKQKDFLEDDLIWRVLVKGSIDDYKLIKKVSYRNRALKITCSRGFAAKKNMQPTKNKPWNRVLIKSQDFDRYHIKWQLGNFNWNQELNRRRDEDLYRDNRILIAIRPIPRDRFKLRCIYTNEELIFRDDILCFKSEEITNYPPYLAILNSSFTGYYLFKISAQWDGGIKRSALRTYDIKSFPFPDISSSDNRISGLIELVNQVELFRKNGKDPSKFEQKIDEVVFDLYGLLDFEKEMIREFYQVNVERKNDPVTGEDIQKYVDQFRRNFSSFLAKGFKLNAGYWVLPHIGAAISLQIVNEKDFKTEIVKKDIPILDIVKNRQLQQSFLSKMLNEDKVKIYDDNIFYIIKSKYFKDWTIIQAMDDASEEIGLLLKNLPDRNNAD